MDNINDVIKKETYKKAGYQFYISWNEQHHYLGLVAKGFPTTYDAVDSHMENLHNDIKAFNINCVRL